MTVDQRALDVALAGSGLDGISRRMLQASLSEEDKAAIVADMTATNDAGVIGFKPDADGTRMRAVVQAFRDSMEKERALIRQRAKDHAATQKDK